MRESVVVSRIIIIMMMIIIIITIIIIMIIIIMIIIIFSNFIIYLHSIARLKLTIIDTITILAIQKYKAS